MSSPRNFHFRVSHLAILLFVWGAVANAQSTGSKPKPTGSISGRVTIDGKAAAGIPVAVIAGTSINRRDARARTISDPGGNYRISGLTAGEYQVWTMTPALAAEPAAPYYAGLKSILLSADEEVSNVDLKLIRGAAITGRVTNADNKPVVDEHINLQLLDANGNPRFGALSSSYDQMFTTDDRGIYRIFGLAPGRYRVSAGYDAANDGMRPGRHYVQTSYLDPNDQTKAGIVDLHEGDVVQNIDIRLGAVASTYSVSGRVIDTETGVPIAKAGVRFIPIQDGKNSPSGGIGAQADESGEFTLSGVSPGHYSVNASSDIYGGNFYSDPILLDVTDKNVTGFELKTVPGLTLSGHLSADRLSTPELMKLLPNMVVIASGTSGPNQTRIGGRATVAPDGSFEIGGLHPGPITVFLSTRFPGAFRIIINRMEREGVAVNQNFPLKESLTGLNVVLDYGTAIIRGAVKFETDTPIIDSFMVVNYKRQGAREGNAVVLDARGHFVLTNLAPGAWELTLQVNNMTPRPPRGVPPQKQIVNVVNGHESEITFNVDLGPKQGGP